MEYSFAKSVNILGTTYSITVDSDDPGFGKEGHPGAFGYCNSNQHKIVLRDRINSNAKNIPEYKQLDILLWMKKTLRHEIIHAYLHESGLSHCTWMATKWAMNEEMIDWLAIQGPKIMKTWAEAGALDNTPEIIDKKYIITLNGKYLRDATEEEIRTGIVNTKEVI